MSGSSEVGVISALADLWNGLENLVTDDIKGNYGY